MRAALALGLLLLASGAAARTPTDAEVDAVASRLRCVVCQNLSVADSPSEMARQMRDLIRARLEQGETPEQVIAYFVERYGEWVLLAPRPQGFTLLVWVLPFAGLLGGLGGLLLVARRWSRRPEAAPPPALSAEDRERVRLELERFQE